MKKYLVLLVIIICSVFGFSQQKTDSSQPTLSTDLTVQMNLRTDLEIYKGKVDMVSNHIATLQDRQDKRIDSVETFIYWILALISGLFVLLGIFLALFTYKTNRDYKKAETEFKDASKTLREAKRLQDEAKEKTLEIMNSIQKLQTLAQSSIQLAGEIRQRAQDSIDYEITQGKTKISELIDAAQKKLNLVVDEAVTKVIAEIDKRNEIDLLLRRYEMLEQDNKGADANNTLDKILKLDPRNERALHNKARLYFRGYGKQLEKDTEKALDFINQAIAEDPNARNLRLRSYIYASLNHREKAIQDIQLARNKEADDISIKLEETEIFLLVGKFQEASSLLKEIDSNELPQHDQISYRFLELVLKNIDGNVSNEQIEKLIETYKNAHLSLFPWDLAQINEKIHSKDDIFNNEQKERLQKMCECLQKAIEQIDNARRTQSKRTKQ